MQGISFLPGFGKAFDNLDPQKDENFCKICCVLYHTCKVSESFSTGGCVSHSYFLVQSMYQNQNWSVTGLIKNVFNGKNGLSLVAE